MPAKPESGTGYHPRNFLADSLVYPVISRRSGGLSIGINLFPDRKTCTFDCPYCEVLPHSGSSAPKDPDPEPSGLRQSGLTLSGIARSDIPGRLRSDLDEYFERIHPETFARTPPRDLCVSGDGEPTLSPHLESCLGILESLRNCHPVLLGKVPTVIITNSTGFADPKIRATLARFSAAGRLDIWAKLDAGTEKSFRIMSGSGLRLDDIVASLFLYSRAEPVIIQSMVCRVGDFEPDSAELRARASILAELAARGAAIRAVQIYTLARPASHPCVSPSPDSLLVLASDIFASALPPNIPIATYGPEGRIA